MNTSLITVLSSTHGRLRREQRDIDKRDLQRALRYGRRERAWGQRWQVEHDGITFITDSTMRKEITAYPSPLPDAPIEMKDRTDHQKAKRLLDKKPELATSHTVLVLDNSGSMLSKKNNVHLYRDSQNAAVSMTAIEFVAEQLFSETATNSDLVSLVTFRSTASAEISREPIDWVVYNNILQHRNCDKYWQRKDAPVHDQILAQSNYLPALDKAFDLLKDGYHDKCAMSLFFLFDGASTDHQKLGISSTEAVRRMVAKVKEMATHFGENLSLTTVGLGEEWDDFSSLKDMASAASDAGSKGSFEYCNKTANAITSAISSLVASTTETRTSIHEGRRHGYT